ncbi:MAG: hypothetical protein KDD55_05895 [Bdellovibrionales bacterium]|nr:hypothetical protein [Bdellovibrionales bacterium]
MEIALTIMIAQGVLGAFDTIYYHEYVYLLPVYGPKVGGELRLHALRDFVYGLLFLTLPFVKWQGALAIILGLLILLEICITIWDFNIEVIERADIGGVANEERGLHLIMAVVYGFFLAHLIPNMWSWYSLPTGFGKQEALPIWMTIVCVLFGTGVVLSGVRDLGASKGIARLQVDIFGREKPNGPSAT